MKMHGIILLGISLSVLKVNLLNAYLITNSSKSNIVVAVNIADGSLIKASYRLEPGEHGAWNQNEIRKKLKREFLSAGVYSKGLNVFDIKDMPIDANLEILAVTYGTGVAGGAKDLHTGKFYNEVGYNFAKKLLANE